MEEQQKQTVAKLKQHLTDLPVLPVVVMQLLRLDSQSDSYFEDVSRLVASDPGYAVKVISLANSAAMSPSRPVTRVCDAVVRIGAGPTVNTVLAASAVRVFLPRNEWERGIWTHSLDVAYVAGAMSALVPHHRLDRNELYLGGLLHDIGRFVLYLEAPDELHNVDETDWHTPQELIDTERKLCGFDHAELGYQAALKWKLPDQLARVVRFHHADRPPLSSIEAEMITYIRLADWVSIVLGREPDWRSCDDERLRDLLSKRITRSPGFWNGDVISLVRNAMQTAFESRAVLGL